MRLANCISQRARHRRIRELSQFLSRRLVSAERRDAIKLQRWLRNQAEAYQGSREWISDAKRDASSCIADWAALKTCRLLLLSFRRCSCPSGLVGEESFVDVVPKDF